MRGMRNLSGILASLFAAPALALAWSDTSLNWRYGSDFSEPYRSQTVHKNIFGLVHANGYRYGTNFLSADFLLSDQHDPARAGSTEGASEIYVVYRHTLDLNKTLERDFQWGPIRGLGLTAGFDWNTKRDAGYNSRKEMLVLGPTVMLDVPGYLNLSLLWLNESNNPSVSPNAFDPGFSGKRYTYRTHAMVGLVWGIPLNPHWSFSGYANFIEAKGNNELGASTAPETNLDAQLMYDASAFLGERPQALKLGVAYQYWKNKFGNDAAGPAGSGAFARTPMLRAEYRF